MINPEEKKKILDNIKMVEGILIHMNIDPGGKSDHQVECREVIRTYLRNIRVVCGQKFQEAKPPDECSLQDLRDITTCPFCGHVQVAVLGINEHCEKGNCLGIVVDYYHQLTWKWNGE